MDNEEILEKLILEGSVEVAGIDSRTGEFLYAFTKDLHRTNPGLHKHVANHFNENIMSLWEKGFLDINFLSDSPMVKVTEKVFDADSVLSLPENLQLMLEQILQMMKP